MKPLLIPDDRGNHHRFDETEYEFLLRGNFFKRTEGNQLVHFVLEGGKLVESHTEEVSDYYQGGDAGGDCWLEFYMEADDDGL